LRNCLRLRINGIRDGSPEAATVGDSNAVFEQRPDETDRLDDPGNLKNLAGARRALCAW
jgi:hypothetical protein